MAAKRPRSTDHGTMFIRPFHLLLPALAHWVNREQSNVINYLREESRILRERNRQGLGKSMQTNRLPSWRWKLGVARPPLSRLLLPLRSWQEPRQRLGSSVVLARPRQSAADAGRS